MLLDDAPFLTATDAERTETIVAVLDGAFADFAERAPEAFARKYRTMAGDPFRFFRGTAHLFYADVTGLRDDWATGDAASTWIQGDLHAENFGTYMDGSGHLVFDVNDFDEAYLGHFTWDLMRFTASLALLGWSKALSDEALEGLCHQYLRSYLDQVQHFAGTDGDRDWALRLGTATGEVRRVLRTAQTSTRIALLDEVSLVEDSERRLRDDDPTVRRLDDGERGRVEAAFSRYLGTIPESQRLGSLTYRLKDVVAKSGLGIGSRGLPAYSLLVEGHTEALENDVVLTMKQGQVSAVGQNVGDARAQEHFEHAGHRTAVSQRALQAYADPWLGWTALEGGSLDGVGFVVKEFSPYEQDLEWADVVEPAAMAEIVDQLGRATAKVHCVSDADSGTSLVDVQVEQAICAATEGRADEFVADVSAFALAYAQRTRADHGLFVDAFRAGMLRHV